MNLSHLALLLVLQSALSLPRWSWDTVQTYVHCANFTGEWNDDALKILAEQPFVVFEKYHKIFEEPVCDKAEAKIQESCRKVKALNPDTDCYIYTESDWARTEYSLGHWFNANPQSALQCPKPGDMVGTEDTVCYSKGNCTKYHYLTYDFNNSDAREHWIERVTSVVSSGYVDGAFIDGNRGGWMSSSTGPCSKSKREAWAQGLSLAVKTLAERLGPNKTLISNYPTHEALQYCVGGMMERGGSSQAIQEFGKKKCGLYNQSCLLDYHAQYFSHPADGKLASFLLGAQEYAYFGGGSGWGSGGPGACALWLKMWPEFSKPLGEPLGDMVATTGPYPGAVCETSGGRKANHSGCVYSRSFKSGTKVTVGQYLPPDNWQRPRNQGQCIYWSDGTVTSSNEKNCMPKHLIG